MAAARSVETDDGGRSAIDERIGVGGQGGTRTDPLDEAADFTNEAYIDDSLAPDVPAS